MTDPFALASLVNKINTIVQSCDNDILYNEWRDLVCENTFSLEILEHFYTRAQTFMISVQDKLSQKIPFFAENPEIFQDACNGNAVLISGLVQSGKTSVIIGMSIYNVLVLKRPTVIIIRNYTADYYQLKEAFRSSRFAEFNVPVVYAGDCNPIQMFNSRNPAVTICLENEAPMRKIVESFDMLGNPEFCLIADEADAICYKKFQVKRRISLFHQIKDRAFSFYGVTATAFDMMFMETKLDSKSIYKLPVPVNYKGVNHPDFSVVELPKNFVFRPKTIKNNSEYKLPEDMEEFYEGLLNEELDDEKNPEHPIICLQKTGTKKEDQLKNLQALIHHPLFGKAFVIIVYNGDGVYLYVPKQMEEALSVCLLGQPNLGLGKEYIENTFPHITKEDRVLFYERDSIGNALQLLKDINCGKSVISHILIIAGQIVGRGLNMSSKDYEWHLTHQILQVSNTATCSDITQSCRLFGIYNDCIKTKLYCLQKDSLALKQCHELQDRLIEGADLHDETIPMMQLCKQVRVFVKKIPKRITNKLRPVPVFNTVATEEEQYSEPKEQFVRNVRRRTERGEGEFYLVQVERLAPRELEIYNAVIDYMIDHKNEWFARARLVDAIMKPGMEMHCIRAHLKDFCLNDKNMKTDDEHSIGLLFKKNGNRWNVRYNVAE